MIIVIKKQTVIRLMLSLTSIVLIIIIYITSMLTNTFVYVYNIKGTADEEREYWVNSEDIFWDLNINEKLIALTFDDGPHPRYTPRILDILSKYEVKATFFVIGKQAALYPDVLKMIHEQGNEIANHTYSHPWMKTIGTEKLLSEIEKTHQVIYDITGKDPVLFRPPGGYYNKRIVESVKHLNYKIILWSFTQDTKDWGNPGVKKIVNGVLNNAKNGDIIIFHDSGSDRSQTIEALEIIIPALKKKGFDMVTVTDLLDMKYTQPVQ